MCVIISVKTAHPSAELLTKAERRNPHGAGVAWLHDGKVRWKKGLLATDVSSMIAEGALPFPYVVHFRLASIGEQSPELCHPFPIDPQASLELEGEADEVVFHNGTWSDYEEHSERLKLEGAISDSRVLAAFLAVNRKHADMLLDHYSTRAYSNRFALMTPKGPILYGQWWRQHGVDLSNTYFL